MSNASGREIELELIRVRAEAAAARLEARAAELELMLLAQQTSVRVQQQTFYQPTQTSPIDRQPVTDPIGNHAENSAEELILAIRRLMQAQTVQPSGPTGWESRLQGVVSRQHEQPVPSSPANLAINVSNQPSSDGANEHASGAAVALFADRISKASVVVAEPASSVAIEPVRPDAKPEVTNSANVTLEAANPDSVKSASDRIGEPTAKAKSSKTRSDAAKEKLANDNLTNDNQTSAVKPQPQRSSGMVQMASSPAVAVSIAQSADDRERPKRVRPASWLVSTIAHFVVLLVLGLFTLASPKPKDQLAFSASVSEASETAVESLTIEAIEEMPDVSEPSLSEAAADVSPLGTMPMAEVSLDLPIAKTPPMNPPSMSSDMSSQSMKLAKASVKGDTPSNVQFAGVEGGGNHFVYLVDSSNSMKNFNEARVELLRSVDALKPDQRFYVVFYDEQPDFMRISNPSVDEPASVYATPANKQAFRRWAMTTQQQKGKSPPEVLEFAFKLRPDVIFLLSDGEFSEKTETVIRQANRQENLFGDSGPVSIIHTIRYPGVSSTEGRQAEVQMRRIAEENGGQYRNVELK